MKNFIIILIMSLFLISCKKIRMRPCPDCFFFYFEDPQPNNDSELDRFPHRFRGVYKNEDSTFLKIDEDRMVLKYYVKSKIHKNELDSMKSEYLIFKDRLLRKNTNEKVYLHSVGDSLELTESYLDTIFRFSYYQKLKQIDRQLIVSNRDSIFWNIEFLSLNNNNILKFKEIYLPTDLKKLDSITEVKAEKLDSMSYLIKATRNEFKKILKIKTLGVDQEYKKIPNQTW